MHALIRVIGGKLVQVDALARGSQTERIAQGAGAKVRAVAGALR